MLVRRDKAMLAVSIMLDVAFHAGRTATVSAGDLAERLGLARRGMEPLLQALSRAGLLESIRGPGGGYRLGRARREIRLSDIISVALAEEAVPTEGPSGRLQAAVVDRVWTDLDEGVRAQLAALSLEDLVRRAGAAGLRRPTAEPISFAI
jgi:Rrf2 family protein